MRNSKYLKSILKKQLLLFFVVTLFWGCNSAIVNTAIIPTDKLQDSWWKDRHIGVLDSLVTNPQLILIGNSILHTLDSEDRKNIWAEHLNKYNTLNMGFSGDRTENVIWRLQNGELNNINPKVALVLIGTNNTDGNNYPTINYPNELEEATWRICEIIKDKLPNTQIILLGILPFGKHIPNFRNTINKKTNMLIANFPNSDNNIHFVDIGNIFLNPEGEIIKDLMPDYLHPNVEGHMLMFNRLEGEIFNLMKK